MAFELAWLPRFLQRPLATSASYADPVRVGIGQARYFHRRPRNPLVWLVRRLSTGRSLARLERIQPPSGGFLEAVPWTSFLVMGLASTGRVNHPVARRGLGFLLDTVHSDASWPIETSLSVWNTSLSINALASASGHVGALGCLDWLLGCQRSEADPLTGTPSGGWSCNNGRGSVAATDDTTVALLALSVLLKSGGDAHRPRIEIAAAAGINWLLAVQNSDGGWPTFRRTRAMSGFNRSPLDGSGADLTALALRALRAWQYLGLRTVRSTMPFAAACITSPPSNGPMVVGGRCGLAIQIFPARKTRFTALARSLLAYRDLDRVESPRPNAAWSGWLLRSIPAGDGGRRASSGKLSRCPAGPDWSGR